MGTFSKVIGGVFFLIAVFLFMSNWQGTVAIVDTVAKNSIAGVKTLQGRG